MQEMWELCPKGSNMTNYSTDTVPWTRRCYPATSTVFVLSAGFPAQRRLSIWLKGHMVRQVRQLKTKGWETEHFRGQFITRNKRVGS